MFEGLIDRIALRTATMILEDQAKLQKQINEIDRNRRIDSHLRQAYLERWMQLYPDRGRERQLDIMSFIIRASRSELVRGLEIMCCPEPESEDPPESSGGS